MVHVRISTFFELVGFGFLDGAAWHFNSTTGLIVSGVIFLFIGYSLEDEKTALVIHRFTSSVKGLFTRKAGKP